MLGWLPESPVSVLWKAASVLHKPPPTHTYRHTHTTPAPQSLLPQVAQLGWREHPGLLALAAEQEGGSLCASVSQSPGQGRRHTHGPPSCPGGRRGRERSGWPLERARLCLRGRPVLWELPQSPHLLPPPPPLQDFHSLATYLSQNASSVFLDTVSDFHLLLFLVTNDVMPLQVRAGAPAPGPETRSQVPHVPWPGLCTRGWLAAGGRVHTACLR